MTTVQDIIFYIPLETLFVVFFLDDHSRVRLENLENDYINASLITMEEAQRNYILTQV